MTIRPQKFRQFHNVHKFELQQGFTLIELVMIIVILGVMTAIALPKFSNLGGNAKLSAIKGALGAMKSTNTIVHSKSLTSGIDTGTITLEGTAINVAGGYPTADAILAASGIDSADFDRVLLFLGNRILLVWKGRCLIAYLDSRFNGRPLFFGVINVVNNSCDL